MLMMRTNLKAPLKRRGVGNTETFYINESGFYSLVLVKMRLDPKSKARIWKWVYTPIYPTKGKIQLGKDAYNMGS